jgi:16S rRNA G1207 methylase RsmC
MNLPKSPEDMNLDELKMLLEIRKLELKNSLQEVKHRLGIGGRILRAIQKSGIIESFAQTIQTYTSQSNPPAQPKPQTESESGTQDNNTTDDESIENIDTNSKN